MSKINLSELLLQEIPSSLNISIKDYISSEHPLKVPFHVDETSRDIKVKLHFICKVAEHTADNKLRDVQITFCTDGIERIAVNDAQASIDLSQWIVPGWNEITIQSNDLIKIIGQLNVRSLIKF